VRAIGGRGGMFEKDSSREGVVRPVVIVGAGTIVRTGVG